jgi:hypothetical protein
METIEHRDENGKLHRPHELGPAIISSNGYHAYYENGEIHRPHELGPAIIGADGYHAYYEHGKCHRPVELGPAIIRPSGMEVYYEHGKIHRPAELGPAVIWANGNQEYYENGIEKTLKEFQAIYKIQRWFRWYRIFSKYRNLFEKVIALPANYDSVLGRMYPEGGDLYKETYKSLQNLLESF